MAMAQHTAVPDGCHSVLTFSSERPATTNANGDIHTRSLSPWTWRRTTAEHRIPSTIWEAECSESYCSEPSQPGRARNNAVAIYNNVLVLNRRQGENCYVASYQVVSVGCTCVRPEIL
ncbi:hypothetical protein CRUP_007997 [Coryphaenoides rupestris]|nr:hypothetical protein CRUP_007997 [Coryphaenoides rupestris]